MCCYVGIALDAVQVYNTCANPKIKQSLEDYTSEKVLHAKNSHFLLHLTHSTFMHLMNSRKEI